MRLEVVISGKGVASEEIMHRLVELEPQWRTLMVEEEKDAVVVALTHTDLNGIRDFEQWMEIANLPEPDD